MLLIKLSPAPAIEHHFHLSEFHPGMTPPKFWERPEDHKADPDQTKKGCTLILMAHDRWIKNTTGWSAMHSRAQSDDLITAIACFV